MKRLPVALLAAALGAALTMPVLAETIGQQVKSGYQSARPGG